jgi:hypothetical protein
MSRSFAALAVAIGSLAAVQVAGGAVVQSVTGSSLIHIVGVGPCAGQLGVREFTARKYDDGSVAGQSQIHVLKEQGEGPTICDGDMYHGDLDCLQVFGNVAIASGPVTHTNDAAADFLGRTEILAVEDNGDAPDRIVRVPPLPFGPYPATATCLSFSLAVIQLALNSPGTGYEAEAGNVEIH